MKLYICQTLDGFIAKDDGGIDFLDQFNDLILNSQNQKIKNSYPNFIENIDTVVEGYTTYEQIKKMGYGEQYRDFNHYVITNSHQQMVDENVTKFVDFNQLEALKLNNESTFLVGGRQIIKEAFNRKLVSTIIITQLPIFLGQGIKLFDGINVDVDLELTDLFHDNKFYQVEYQVNYL